jgi:hypothetical protein
MSITPRLDSEHRVVGNQDRGAPGRRSRVSQRGGEGVDTDWARNGGGSGDVRSPSCPGRRLWSAISAGHSPAIRRPQRPRYPQGTRYVAAEGRGGVRAAATRTKGSFRC